MVRFVPLRRAQRVKLAGTAGATDPEGFAVAAARDGLNALAERPGDLLDLATYWTSHGRFGTLSEMTEHAVARRLRDKPHRRDDHVLEDLLARLGAERVAAGLTFGRSSTLKAPDAGSARFLAAGAIDPAELLPDWTRRNAARWSAGEPSHPRRMGGSASTTEARRSTFAPDGWTGCCGEGVGARRCDLHFSEPYGLPVVVPSLRPVAAWLARERPAVLDEVIRRDFMVLLRHGDPRSLPIEAKEAAARGPGRTPCERRGVG